MRILVADTETDGLAYECTKVHVMSWTDTETESMVCPLCGNPPKTTETKYGRRNSCCNLWSWGISPLVCKDTHEARKQAHKTFDILWKNLGFSRSDCYRILYKKTGYKHIKDMPKGVALKVPSLALEIRYNNENISN